MRRLRIVYLAGRRAIVSVWVRSRPAFLPAMNDAERADRPSRPSGRDNRRRPENSARRPYCRRSFRTAAGPCAVLAPICRHVRVRCCPGSGRRARPLRARIYRRRCWRTRGFDLFHFAPELGAEAERHQVTGYFDRHSHRPVPPFHQQASSRRSTLSNMTPIVVWSRSC